MRLLSIFLLVVWFGFSGKAISANAKALRFVQLTDLHVSPGAPSDFALAQLVDTLNGLSCDFVVVTGDLTNTGSNEELDAAQRSLSKLKHPCYVIPGNHETNWSESAGVHFNQLFGGDRFLFRKNEFLCVGFSCGPFMKMGDGFVKQEDLQWLQKNLKKKRHTHDQVISFNHYPLADGLSNYQSVLDVLINNNCILSFCGHGHQFKELNFNGLTGIMGDALLHGDKSKPCYQVIQLRNDSVYVNRFELGTAKSTKQMAIRYHSVTHFVKSSTSHAEYTTKRQAQVDVQWRIQESSSLFGDPAVTPEGNVVIGNSVGEIKLLDGRTGSCLWKKKYSGSIYSTPVCSDDIIIFGTIDGKLIALNAKNGDEKWCIPTGAPVLGEGIVQKGKFFIGNGVGNFYKIDLLTGKVDWQNSSAKGLVQGRPATSGDKIVYGAWDTGLYCLDSETGKLIWRWTNGKSVKLYSPGNIVPIIANGVVSIVAPDRCMTAIDLLDGKQLWRNCSHQVRESMGGANGSPVVYCKTMNDSLLMMEPVEGGLPKISMINIGFGYEHNPSPLTVTDKEVMITTRKGEVMAFDRHSLKVNWSLKLGEGNVSKVVQIKNGVYVVSLTDGQVVKIVES